MAKTGSKPEINSELYKAVWFRIHWPLLILGATGETRIPGLVITNHALYQLSYSG